ncbi:MAG: type I methionyl aminopeptidase [Ardenticatenaceae bacterium]|nr:type I methionyl aminopeptidase [Ardenticatenaceae bacterium]HBY98501.1 type I methionyl aminopeptidase [Chloroflexota bacterium]
MIILKSDRELALMREAGRVVAQAHDLVRSRLRPGITTAELDRGIEGLIRGHGGIPSFKNYPHPAGLRPFPGSSCISVNEELVHGIPGPRRLQEGDIVSVDVGVIYKGYHGDAAWTYIVGEAGSEARRLLDVTEQALWAGIERAREGGRLSDIGHAIQTVVESNGFSVVREYVGHGVGRQMHEEPQIPNYGDPGRGPRLRAGMTLAIEPMVQAGDIRTRTLDDQWTVISYDRSLTAHFEHTVAITKDGPILLTIL